MSYYSKVFYTVTSETQASKAYTIQFGLESGTATTNNRPYIHTSHIKAKIDGTLTTAFTVSEATNPSRLTFNEGTTLAVGSVIEIYRETPRSATTRAVDFEDASVLTEADLDLSAIGALFITQEIIDKLETLIPGGGSTAQLLAKRSSADYDIEWVNNALVEINAANAGGVLTWNQNGAPYVVAPTDNAAYVPRVARGNQGGATMSKGGIVKIGGSGPLPSEGAVGDLWIYIGSGGVDVDGNYPGDVFLKTGPTSWLKLYNYTGIGGGDTTTGVAYFTDLLDTPADTDGDSGKYLYVKPNGDIGFTPYLGGYVDTLQDVNFNSPTGPTTGDILVWDGALDGTGAWTLSPGVQTASLDGLSKGSVLASDSSAVMSPVTPGSSGLYLKSNLSNASGVEWATGTASGGGLSSTAVLVQDGYVGAIVISGNTGFYPFGVSTLTDIQDTDGANKFTNWNLDFANRFTFGEAGMYRIRVDINMTAVDAASGTVASEYPVRVSLLMDTQHGAGLHVKDQKVVIVPSSGGAGANINKLTSVSLNYSGYLQLSGGSPPTYPYFGLLFQSAVDPGIAVPGIHLPQTVPNPPAVDPSGNWFDERLPGLRVTIEKF